MALATAAALAMACSKAADPEPRLRSVQPAQGSEGAAVAIRIEGEGLDPHVLTDYGDAGASVVDARFEAWLGTHRLRDVRPSGDGAVLATVPEDLPGGTYDLAVADPAGKRATLPAAYRVLAPTDVEVLVASFRFDPVAPQVASAPFTVTVTALDAAGQPVTGFSGTVALSDRTGALVPSSAGPFAWGRWTGPVEVRAPAGADALAAADGLGHTGTSNAFAVLPAPAARVVFSSPAVDAIAGACAGPVTIALEDLYGAPTFASTPVDVAVSGGAAAVYADPACAVAAAGTTIAAGATSASVYVRSTLAAPFTVDASAASLGPAAQAGLVRPAPPARLVYTTPPQTLAAGTCSAAATVLAEDAFGNVSPVAADTAIALSATAAAGLTFHGAAGCGGAPATAVTLPAAGSTATFWFRATVAQPVSVSAAGAGIAGAATQGETIVPAAPESLAFVTPPQAVAAGSCSGLATVEARDAFGNAAPVAAGTLVSLAAAPSAGFTFHLDPACGDAPTAGAPLAPGATATSFRFRATVTGAYGVTAAGAGLAGAATQVETVGPAAADRVVFTSAPKSATAGQCSGPLAVEVRDGLGNAAPVAAATPVSLAAAPATGTILFATPDCTGPSGGPASVPAGSAAATFSFRSTRAGTFDATATVAGLLPATQAQAVLPAAPERLVFTSAAQTLTAGTCSAAATLEARDAYDNVAPVAALTPVALVAGPATGFQLLGAAGCGGAPIASVDLAAGASAATFWFRGTATGSVTVTATGAGIATPATQVETIGPAAPDRLVFASAPQTVTAGVCSGAATVQALDAFGNVAPVAALTSVALAAAPGAGFQLFDAAGCGGAPVTAVDLAAAASTATFWFRGTVAGAVAVTATGAAIATPAAQAETIRPAAPDRLVFTSAAQTVTAGSCSGAAMVEARDAFGNAAPVAALTPVALGAAPPSGFAFFGAAACGGAPAGSVDVAAGATSATFWFRGTLATTVTVTASGAGIATPATQAETILPAAPDRLVFTTAPQTVTAGSCSGAAAVEVRDAFDNVAPVAALTPVALGAAPASGFAFFGGPGCGGAPVASVDVAAGASDTTFWFRGIAAGTVTVTAAGAGIPGAATQVETVNPAAPAAVVFTTAPQTLTAGVCSGTVRIELRDVHGNPTSDAGAATALALAASPAAGFELFEDAACGTPVPGAAIAIPAGSVGKDLWFRGTLATAVTLASAPSGLSPASQVETILPAAPDRLVLTTAPQSVPAGVCSAVAGVEARDAFDNVAPVAALTAVALAAAPGTGFAFHRNAGCGGAAVTSVDIAANATTTTFWFRATAAGPVTVTATGAGIPTPATQVETIRPAAPDRLVFTTSPQAVTAGVCSGAATVEARDAFDNVAPVAALTAVALAAAPAAGFELFDAAGCAGAPVASIALAAGAASTSLWFRGTAVGSVTVTADGAGIPTPAAQAEAIGPAAPDRLVFTSAPQTVTAGACSGAATLEARDAFGNVAPVAALTDVALSAAPAGGLAFFDSAGCGGAPVDSVGIAVGATGTTLWFKGTVAGSVGIAAAGAGIATPAAQTETVRPAAPDRLVFTSPPRTVTAGVCSAAATVEARDAFGNVAPVAALTAVALSAAPAAGFTFHALAGCGDAPVTSTGLAAGASTATFWFRGTAVGTVTVTAAGAGIAGAATQAEAVQPAPPAAVVFVSAPQTVTAGSCSGAARLELRDAFGNPTADGGAAVALALLAAPAAGFELFEDAGCAVAVPGASIAIAAGSVGKDFWFEGTLAASVTLTSAPAGLVPASQVETIRPAAPDRLVFTTPPQTVTAGTCSVAATVEARDVYGNVAPVAALTPVALSAAPPGGFELFDAAGCGGAPATSVSIAAAASSASFWFRGTVAGSVSVTASGAGIATPAGQTETVAPAAPNRLVFTTGPQTVIAGTCSAGASVEGRDAYGNVAPVAAATAVSLSAAPAAGFQLFDAAGCGGAAVASVSIPAGASGATFWFRGTAAGAVTVTAAGAGIPGAATQAEIVQPAAPDRLFFTTAAQTVAAGTCSGPATVEARDVFGNAAPVPSATSVALSAVPAAGFQLFDGSGCGGVPATSVGIAAGGTSATFSFRGTVAGAVTVTASGAGIPTAATQAETIDPAAPDRLVFTTGAQTLTAGVCSAPATVEARDVYGNVARVAALTAVYLSAAPAAGFELFDAAGCGGAPVTSVSIAAGGSSATLRFRGTAAGAVTVTAAGEGIPLPATQIETVDPAVPAAVVFTSAPQVLKAGVCSGTARLELRDAFGNATADPGAAIALALAAAPAAGFELFEDPACAVAVPGAGIAIAAGAAGKDFWFRGTVTNAVTLTSAPAGLAGASQVETIDPAAASRIAWASAPATAVAGVCSSVVAVVSLDAYGNVAPVVGATTVALSAAPAAGFELHAAAGCGGAPVSSTVIPAGGTNGTFRFSGTSAGAVTVTASAFGTSADQPETILPAAPNRLVFTSAPQTVTAGACSAAATVEARDAYDNVAPVAALTSVALSAAPAGGFAFFDAAGCGGAAVTSVAIALGGSSATLWFRGTVAGAVTVAASGAGISWAASQGETVAPATPDRLVFTTAAQTVTAGTCSGAATVEARDAYGNAAPVAALTSVALSAAPAGGFAFFDAAGCGGATVTSASIAAGGSSATFWFRGTVAGAVTVAASGAGIPTAASQGETIAPAAPDRLVFTTAAQTIAAGACSAAASVEARDVHGNVAPVAALTTVSLSAVPAAGFQHFDAAGCGGAAVTSVSIPAGGSSATFWFRGTAAGPVEVTASGADIPTAAAQAETVTPAPPAALVFTTAPQTLAAGSCSAAATVEARDAYGNPSPVAAPTAVTLAAAPVAGFAFHDAAGCGGAPVGSASVAAGSTTATFWMRATAVGAVSVTATGAGIPTPATQVETITPGPTDHFVFDPVLPTWIRTWSYAVRVQAMDAFGNPTPAFTGTATLGLTVPQPPNGAGATLSCTAGCGSGTDTTPFVAGAWTGSLATAWADPDPQKLGISVGAVGSGAWSAVTGTSAAFDVIGAVRSPPTGRITASPVVVFVNQAVTFDASGSTDYQTATASLEVSWDFQGSSTAVPAYPTPAAPWTGWTTTKTASNVYTVAGTYTARVAVRDADGDVGFGSVSVVVLPVGSRLCVVTTAADVDDGATSCAGPGFGADGQLSLAEALRLAPSFTTITFASPMTISGTGVYTIALDDITIVAPAGTVLDGKSLAIAGTRARVVGLELANQATPVVVSNKKIATFEDCNLHDMPGITDYGTLTLTRVRMASCVGQCVSVTDATNFDTLTIRYSSFFGGPGTVGLDVAQCKSGKLALVSQSNVFAGFATAVRIGSLCAGYTNVRHTSFASNGIGIAYGPVASWNHVLRNSIFSGHATAAVTCGLANFANRDAHLLYQNASDGCLPGDPGTLVGDPAYLFAPAGDYRVGLASPAVDSAPDLGLFLLPQYPATAPQHLGAGPDRGGRESW